MKAYETELFWTWESLPKNLEPQVDKSITGEE